jgi:hypothetical protein
MTQPVSDIGSNAQENIAHAAQVLGRSVHRRRVFDAIYTGKLRRKTVKDLMDATGLSQVRVLQEAKKLAANRIVKPIKIGRTTAYEKDDFFHAHKNRILSLAESPMKLKKYPTKRNPVSTSGVIRLTLNSSRAQVSQVSLEDIETFRYAWGTEGDSMLGTRISESRFKEGLKSIIGEKGQFKDWGGEVDDLFTTRLRLGGKRRATAVALKGPSTKGKLTPGKMGKNGDQIQRLFEAPAELFLVQSCYQIDESVIDQMQRLAIARSTLYGKRVYFGVIDGQDSYRTLLSYPKAFRIGAGKTYRKTN